MRRTFVIAESDAGVVQLVSAAKRLMSALAALTMR